MKIKELRNNIILCKSFSKEFAMTGWRLGYAWANKKIIEKLHDIHLHFSINAVTPSIVAGIAAMSDPRGEQAKQEFINFFKKSREAICQRLDNLPRLFSYHKPEGAYYIFPKYKHFTLNSFDFAKKLVDEAKVITIPGSTMGPSGENHLRMSFAAEPSVIHAAFDRIDKFAKNYNLL
jgi:aminotransferase